MIFRKRRNFLIYPFLSPRVKIKLYWVNMKSMNSKMLCNLVPMDMGFVI